MNLEPNATMNQPANARTTTASRPQTGQYKGHPMIILNPDDRFPFQFGINKAKLVIAHIDAIRSFVESAEVPAQATAA